MLKGRTLTFSTSPIGKVHLFSTTTTQVWTCPQSATQVFLAFRTDHIRFLHAIPRIVVSRRPGRKQPCSGHPITKLGESPWENISEDRQFSTNELDTILARDRKKKGAEIRVSLLTNASNSTTLLIPCMGCMDRVPGVLDPPSLMD